MMPSAIPTEATLTSRSPKGVPVRDVTMSASLRIIPSLYVADCPYTWLLLRSHGENTALQIAFQTLKPLLTPEQVKIWEARLTDDLGRERAFQAKAAASLETAAEAVDNPVEKAAIRFHAGELYRRIEQWDKARALFAKAKGDPQLPDFLRFYLEFAEKRLPKP